MVPSPRSVPKDGTVNVYVWSDFVCPFCFLGEKVIRGAIAESRAQVVWMPFELRPYPTPTLRPEDDYLPRTWERSVYPAARRLHVPIKLPTVSPQPYTRMAFLGMQYAIGEGSGDAYVEAVLQAFFQQDLDVGDPAILAAIAARVGLSRDGFAAALVSEEYAKRHDAQLDLARRIGIEAVPTVLVGKRLLAGMGDAAELRAAIEEADTNLLG